jgi:predicted ATPase/class 3 adenylate cyclase
MDRPTGKLTFLFSDIEGSTRLLMALGEGYAPPHREHQRIVRDGIGAHAGMEVSTEGDSFFVVFMSATDAIAAAADIQRSLAAHAWPEGAEFRVRIGLHSGQAVVAGDDYVGLDVNRAARIANAANGGQTVLSDAVRAAAPSPQEGFTLRDLGRHRLKDVGVEHLWQLDIEGLPTVFGALRSLEAHPTNLPAERTSFIGRETESRALADLVLTSQLVTVTGPGGIGKSRLAVAVARSLIEHFPDGVFYLDLAPHERFESLLSELALVSDTRLPPGDDQVDAFVERFAGRSALLVFDTADRLGGFGLLASRLVEACTELRILVTARAPLHLGAEREFPLSTFDVPPSRRPDDDAIAASPAVQLFVRRAQAVRPDLVLSPENGSTIASIVSRLDGLPLAIELAAARTRVFPPEALLARLERRLPILRGGAVDAPERQRTIQATIAWSYELLEPDERTMLTRLSVFADAFDLEGALAVATHPADGGGTTDPVDVLERLVDRSLVSTVARGEWTGFRLLGIVREFAADELDTGGDAARARDRHARYVLAVAESSTREVDGPGERAALERLERAADDVRAVLERTLAAGVDAPADEDHVVLRLTLAMSRAWYLQGRARDGSDYLERALAADPDAPALLRANALHMSGVLHDERRETVRAMEQLDASLELLRAIGDARLVARELNSVGVVARNAGDTERAAALLEESLAMRRELADLPGLATSLTNLGVVAIDRGRYDEARSLLEEAVGLDRASGASGVVAYSSSLLGTVMLRTGHRAEALDLLRNALATFAELGDADGVAEGLECLGEAMLTEDTARAARLVYAAAAIRRQHDVPVRPPDEAAAARLVIAVETALDAGSLTEARADAAAMDLEAAAAYALASTTS